MAFEYGTENKFYDQTFASAISSAGDYGPVIAGGDCNGALAITLVCTSAASVSGLKLTYKESSAISGSYTAPTDAVTVAFGGSAYAAGDVVGHLVLPNGGKEYVKATISGTISSGGFAAHLQYLAR